MGTDAGGVNRTRNSVTGSVTGVATTAWFFASGRFNMSIFGGTSCTAVLERTFDNGTTAVPCTVLGAPQVFNTGVSEVIDSPELGVAYRLNFTAASGTVNYRLSQ